MKHHLCDHREPRDWRIWRAAPRWWWSCDCCKSSSTSIHVCCCGGIDLPQTLHVTFSASAQCSGFAGKTVTLTYTPNGTANNSHKPEWVGTTTDANGCTYSVEFGCIAANCQFVLNVFDSGGGDGGFSASVSQQCSPLSYSGTCTNYIHGTGCVACTGNIGITATVTE